MFIRPDGSIQRVSVAEHLQRKSLMYQDSQYTVSLSPKKTPPFVIEEGGREGMYIDWFALRFGQKEHLRRKVAGGWTPIHYSCSREERDALLYLPVQELVNRPSCRCCNDSTCQYRSHPTAQKGPYAFNCVLVRYRTMGTFDLKTGMTLQEIGQIYGCTRERIRQIQKCAMKRMRHYTRLGKMRPFRERIIDYRDFTSHTTLDAVG